MFTVNPSPRHQETSVESNSYYTVCSEGHKDAVSSPTPSAPSPDPPIRNPSHSSTCLSKNPLRAAVTAQFILVVPRAPRRPIHRHARQVRIPWAPHVEEVRARITVRVPKSPHQTELPHIIEHFDSTRACIRTRRSSRKHFHPVQPR